MASEQTDSSPRFDGLGRLVMSREEFANGEYTLVEGDAGEWYLLRPTGDVMYTHDADRPLSAFVHCAVFNARQFEPKWYSYPEVRTEREASLARRRSG